MLQTELSPQNSYVDALTPSVTRFGDRAFKEVTKVERGHKGGTEQDSARLYHATQNSAQFNIYELFISGIFHLIFLVCGWSQVNETAESDTTGKGGLL